jgi:hypothetical protein
MLSRQQMLGKIEAEIAGRVDDKNLRRIARKLISFSLAMDTGR